MMNNTLAKIKGKLGFGTLRLPTKKGSVDIAELSSMVDMYMKGGFNYFDLAHAYMGGQCESVMRQALVDRYPREDYILCNKLTWEFFKKEEDITPFFEEQLKACNVSYFDVYLLHALTRYKFEKFKNCNAFKILSHLKEQGKIKTIGISFHDKPGFLRELLNEYPEIELVQIQFNYADYDSEIIQSRKLYKLCLEYSKPCFSMESIKGGSLANLPEDAKSVFDELNNRQEQSFSPADYALRWVAGFENIKVILSGMNNTMQVQDNINSFKYFKPLSNQEQQAIKKVTEIFNSKNMIHCTACRYCTDGCPKHILIPDIFACYNQKKLFNNWNQNYYYNNVLTSKNGKASECVKCGICEKACPQSLSIRELLTECADEFEFKSIAKWVNGELKYFNRGKKDDSFTGLAKTEKGNIVYFKNGIFQKNYNGIVEDSGDELLFINGVSSKTTGARWVNNVLTFFREGKKDAGFTGIARTTIGNLVLITKGVFNSDFTGLISDSDGKIIYLKDGVFEKTYTGEYKNNNIRNGVLCTPEK